MLAYPHALWNHLCYSSLFEHYSNEEKSETYNKVHLLISMYNDPRRKYHNLDHVLYCLKEADKIEKAGSADQYKLSLIRMAIWFHDVIYTASPGDEEESVKFMDAMFPKPFKGMDTVTDMILKTANHGSNHSNDISGEVQVFLDIDMTILAESEDNYKKYRQDIMEEYYSFHPLAKTKEISIQKKLMQGRAQFLKKLLDGPFILFNTSLNKRAVENVTKELETLEKGLAGLSNKEF